MLGKRQNTIEGLQSLKNIRYENIFRLYKNDSEKYYYNLLQSIFLPQNLNPDLLFYQQINQKMPWTIISFNAYKTIDLWWLICLTNQIYNPVKFPDTGTIIKIIKPQYVSNIISEIREALV